jgi:hypothetical protein
MTRKPCYGVRNEKRTEHLPTLQTLPTRRQQRISEHQSGAVSMAQDVNKITSSALYDLAMRLTDAGAKGVDELIEQLCKSAGVEYPPKRD